MVLRAPKKKSRKAKKKKAKISTDKMILSASFFVSITLVSILAFISVEGAVFATGFLACGAFLLYENKQRSFWEKAFSSKFKSLRDDHEKLKRETARNKYDIGALKEGIHGVAQSMDEGEHQTQSVVDRLSALASRPRASSAPREVKTKTASKRKTAPIMAANQDAYDDHEDLSDTIVHELMHHAIRNNQVEVFMQPIVRLPQRQTKFYEIFARIRANPGTYIPAARYIKIAREDGLIHDIDQLLLMQCLKTIQKTAHIEQAPPFFLNITTRTLANKTFMKVLLTFLSKDRALAPRLVFEIQQKDFEAMSPAALEVLRGLGKLGCALSIDHVKDLEFDLKFLQVLKVRFVKINANDLFAYTKDEQRLTDIWRLKRKLEGNGIGFIVEKIENESALRNLLDIDLNYGQGYLFGRPNLQGAYRQFSRKTG